MMMTIMIVILVIIIPGQRNSIRTWVAVHGMNKVVRGRQILKYAANQTRINLRKISFGIFVCSTLPVVSWPSEGDPRPECWRTGCTLPEFADKHHCFQVFWIQMAEDFFKHLYGQHFVD